MRWTLLLLCLFSSVSFAQTLDDYIVQFNMKPLRSLSKRTALYELGRRLFSDNILSGKNNISCASCHSLSAFGGDALPLGVGEGAVGEGLRRFQANGVILARHTPAIYNLGFSDVRTLFWDARVMKLPSGGWMTPEPALNGTYPTARDIAITLDSLLAVQALFPMSNPEEMLGKESKLSNLEAWNEITDRVLSNEQYAILFMAAYPYERDFNIAHIANAIAEFERHEFLKINTPWDLYLRGNRKAMNERMIKGAEVFFSKAKCSNCHFGDHFSSFGFQNVGIPQLGPGKNQGDDKGRFEVTGKEIDLYRFRVPPLRNVALTAPYMHTGAYNTLWQVIDHYNNPVDTLRNFNWNSQNRHYREPLRLDYSMTNLENRERRLSSGLARQLNLTPEERVNLFCFLAIGLTDISLMDELKKKGVLDEVNNCSVTLNR